MTAEPALQKPPKHSLAPPPVFATQPLSTSRNGELKLTCDDLNFTLLLATKVTEPEMRPVNTVSLPDLHACFLDLVGVKVRLTDAIGSQRLAGVEGGVAGLGIRLQGRRWYRKEGEGVVFMGGDQADRGRLAETVDRQHPVMAGGAELGVTAEQVEGGADLAGAALAGAARASGASDRAPRRR